jgi:poly(glycerol-phosphate) alpha-glucosyltransferase
MRVLSVLESASRVDGGIFEAELALQRQLAQLSGVEVDVVALRDEFTDVDAPRWLPLKPKVGEVMGPRGFGFSPRMGEAMSSGVDVGYCAALWKYPAWAFLDWQKRTGKPAVVAPHGSLDAWALQNSKWKKRIAAAIFKDRQLRNATCFRALCSAEADSIRAYGLKQRIEIVPNGVELAEKLTTEDTESTEGKKRLLFLGRIHPKKGLVGALSAWADIQNSKQWQFVIAGWDQEGHEAELKALCSELGLKTASRFSHGGTGSTEGQNLKLKTLPPEAEEADVVFFGPAFGEEKEELLRSASAFILPSLSEGLPMSVLESWAYGLPVVMTPECNLPEGFASQAALEIRNGGMGNRNWEGLRALLDMSDSDRIEMGRRGRRLVEERFTWPKVAAQMHELFQDIA